MDLPETLARISVLEAKEKELWELIVAYTGSPIVKAEYLNELSDIVLRKKRLENTLTN